MALRPVVLDPADAVELGELVVFVRDWLVCDGGRLAGSLESFIGSGAYGVDGLREDLTRFAFLLGADDGVGLFGP